METRDYTPDSDTVQDNKTGDMQQAWTSDETSPVPADNKYKKAVDAFGQMVYADLIRERDELKAEKQETDEENARLRDENGKLHRLASNQALELQDCKDKIIQLQNLFKSQMQDELTVSTDVLHFEYDILHFGNGATPLQVDMLFRKLQELADTKIAPDQYLIDNASAVVPIYILLTQSPNINPIYRYKGHMSDFCKEWNSNVASRIADEERSKKLTCRYESFKSEYGRAPWTVTSPASWRTDIDSRREKIKLERAYNTKVRVESLLK